MLSLPRVTGIAIDALRKQLETVPARLLALAEADTSEALRSGGWSRKQILGHLLDSCINNHYRIVRAVLEGGYSGPSYAQEDWVAVHRYDLLSWPGIVSLWTAHNNLFLHLVEQIGDEHTSVECSGGEEQCTLSGRLDDYTSHMGHHLSQILS